MGQDGSNVHISYGLLPQTAPAEWPQWMQSAADSS